MPKESPEKEADSLEPTIPRELPLLPVRDTVLFPHAVLPLAVFGGLWVVSRRRK